MSYKIAIDSCGELLNEWKDDERIESVPLTLMVGGESIIDDETFDQKDFLKKVAACLECPKSACPSPERYMKAYECEADHIYAVTLSSELSGSYNSAVLGKSLVNVCWEGNRRLLDEIAGYQLEDKPTNSEFIDMLAYYLREMEETS